MRTFKIKGLNCYITLNEQSIEEFNVDLEFIGIVAYLEGIF